MTHEVPKANCPACGYQPDRATAAGDDDAAPTEGSLTICLKCVTALKFGPGMKLLRLSSADFDEMDAGTRRYIVRVQKAIRMAKAEMPRTR